MTFGEETYYAESAAEVTVLGFEVGTQKPTSVVILDETGEVALMTSDKQFLRALAVRLVDLAQELPDPPRTLRRASDIDDQLRDLEP